MVSTYIHKRVFAFVLCFGASAGAAQACGSLSGSPPFPPGPAPQAYVQYDSALADQRNGDLKCALAKYKSAANGFRTEMKASADRSLRWRGTEYLVATLTSLGALEDELGARHEASVAWTQALNLYRTVHPRPSVLSTGDALFARHSFKASFSAYEDAIFPLGANPMVNPAEVDSGAAAKIKVALQQAAAGNFSQAARNLRVVPTSQLAVYLLGQTLYAAARHADAHKIYVETLSTDFQSSAPAPNFSFISYSALQRLIKD